MSSFSGWLAFTFYIGAARDDADPAQLARLREEVLPVTRKLASRNISLAEQRKLMYIVFQRVQAIMGKDWRPGPEWQARINALIGEK